MNESRSCPKCDATLPADAPEGACPKCLLAAGFESADGDVAAGGPGLADVAAQFPELEILGELGRGGMGVVYKARQKNLERMVALKVLPRAIVEGDGGEIRFEDRFTREARALARLSHPNIVGVHEFGEREGMYYFLMEFVDGANLRQAMRAGALDPQQALAIVPQICDALQYAHDQGVVHRDIKPENVLLDTSGRVKIADFGLAKLVARTPNERTLTRQGLVMGTPHYMAPEQIEHPEEVDHRADIYSLGVVLYEMLTGELPIGRFAPPSEKVQIDVKLDEVVLRALEKEADRRYQAVSEVKTGIDAVGDNPSPAPGRRGGYAAKHGPAEASRRSSLALWGLLLPLIAIIGAGLLTVAFTLLLPNDGTSWAVGIPISLAGTLCGLAVLVGFVISIVAVVRIQRSNGALHGMGLAIAGLLMPLLCCVPGAAFSFMMLRVEDDAARHSGRLAPEPYPDVDVIAPTPLLERAGEFTVEMSFPATERRGVASRVDLAHEPSRTGPDPGAGILRVSSTSSWPVPAAHVLVISRVTITGEFGEKRAMVHLGDVVVPGPDESGTDPTWQGYAAISHADTASVYTEVVGDGASHVVLEGYTLRPADLSIFRERSSLHIDDRTVRIITPSKGARVDLAGRVDGGMRTESSGGFVVPEGHVFVIEKVVRHGMGEMTAGVLHVGAAAASFERHGSPGDVLWAGRLEIRPGTEAGVWLTAAEGCPAGVDIFGRVYQIWEPK